MKRFLLTSAALLLASSPALALKITNLDKVPHTVELAGAGEPKTYIIQPGATEIFAGATQGKLSLKSAKNVKKGKGIVQSDGMLSGVIGNGRNQDIPLDSNDNYTIWPGGDIRLQSHVKQSGRF